MAIRDSAKDPVSIRNTPDNVPFGAYHQRDIPRPDPLLSETGPGTPMGEYLRRFWQPVCLTEQLTDVPLAIRIMSEDLVAFRDRSGQNGVLNRYCSHRGASLEYGRLDDEKGIRCCYHGWAFDVDGRILDIPGEPTESPLKTSFHHGAYPTLEFHGIVHAYMGPPELKPDFTAADIFDIPDVEFAAHALPLNNNWLQTHENNVDPVHTVFLHSRYGGYFTDPIGFLPTLDWHTTGDGAGVMYTAGRRVDGQSVWVRTLHCRVPNQGYVPSPYDLESPAYFQRAFYLRVCVPVDDDNCIFFGWRAHNDGEFHGKNSDPAYNGWNKCSLEGQSEQPTYDLKQRSPGDWEAQSSQWGGTSRHQIEHLSAVDGGVALTRRVLRNILEGDVPTAWPEPANGNDVGRRVQNIYSQNTICRLRQLADSDADRQMMKEFGLVVTEAVLDGDRFTRDVRKEHVVSRIKEIEAEFQARYA